MTLTCNDDNTGPDPDDNDPDQLYLRRLINMATFINLLIQRGMSWQEAEDHIKSLHLETTWETRNINC